MIPFYVTYDTSLPTNQLALIPARSLEAAAACGANGGCDALPAAQDGDHIYVAVQLADGEPGAWIRFRCESVTVLQVELVEE